MGSPLDSLGTPGLPPGGLWEKMYTALRFANEIPPYRKKEGFGKSTI